MVKKNTIAALRVKTEMERQSLNGTKLAEISNIPYSAIANILAGKSSKIEKLEAIADSLGKPLMYFIDADYSEESAQSRDIIYDSELHYKCIKTISDLCKKDDIYLTKERMDELVNFIYPRLKKDDPEELIKSQTKALLSYSLRHHK